MLRRAGDYRRIKMCLPRHDLVSFILVVLSSYGYAFYPTEEEADATVTVLGVIGAKARLPCNISSYGEDDEVAIVLWYKDDAASPIFSVDARRGSLREARRVSSDAYRHRTQLSSAGNPLVLSLDVISDDDEGDYWCRVDFKKSRTRNNLIYLQLIDPPAKPIITDHTGEILESLIGPYNEGDRLLLICEVEGGKPQPSVTWWRESVQLDGSYEVSMQGVVRNELEIPALQRHDLMGVFTCQASNNNVSVPSSTSVIVDMNFRPIDVHIEGGPRPMAAGRVAELTCRSSGSRPSAIISWWLEHGRLKHGREWLSEDGNVTTSVLHFRPTEEEADMQLSCRAENPLIPGSALEDSWKLEILYVPQSRVRQAGPSTKLEVGQDAVLHCDVRAHPAATRVLWRFEGRLLTDEPGVTATNRTLFLRGLRRSSRGAYTCEATNSQGKGESEPFFLPVQYAPTCKVAQKIIYAAPRLEPVAVSCEVEADPAAVAFTWTAVNRTLEILRSVETGLRSMATVVPRGEHGRLACVAANRVGVQQEPCYFTLIAAGPPEPVKNCTLTQVTHFLVSVACVSGDNGGMRQKFVMEAHDVDVHALRDNQTAGGEPRFTTRRISPDTSFVLVLYASNARGISDKVVVRGRTPRRPPDPRADHAMGWPESTFTALVSITAVTVGVLLTLLLVLMAMRLKHAFDKRRRKKQWKVEGGSEPPSSQTLKESKCDVCICASEEDEKVTCVMPELLSGDQTRLDLELHLMRSDTAPSEPTPTFHTLDVIERHSESPKLTRIPPR